VSPALQPIPESPEVVDLPVVDDPDGSILVRHRLVTRLEIDSAQAANPEGSGLVEIHALIVRAAALE
jgi:hypothetical protein